MEMFEEVERLTLVKELSLSLSKLFVVSKTK